MPSVRFARSTSLNTWSVDPKAHAAANVVYVHEVLANMMHETLADVMLKNYIRGGQLDAEAYDHYFYAFIKRYFDGTETMKDLSGAYDFIGGHAHMTVAELIHTDVVKRREQKIHLATLVVLYTGLQSFFDFGCKNPCARSNGYPRLANDAFYRAHLKPTATFGEALGTKRKRKNECSHFHEDLERLTGVDIRALNALITEASGGACIIALER